MSSWRRGIGLGFLVWLVPFAISFAAFPLHESARPVFESIMAVAVAGAAVGLGLGYSLRAEDMGPREGLLLGAVWFVMCVLIDAPLMLVGGPMKMSLGAYLGDIALTYVSIPLVTWGLGAASAAGRSKGPDAVG